jgi:capsular exopolysaccharide synthesis family protein
MSNSQRDAMSNSNGALENARHVLRRRWLVIVVAAISVPLAAYLYSSAQQKEYTATATLLFESAENGTIEPSREAATNEALAGLPAVAVRTAEALGEREATGEILSSVSASAANEMANLTKISAKTPSPERSAEIANAYSRAYIDFRREADQSQLKQAIALIERRLEDLPPEQLNGIQGETLRERLNQLEVERVSRTGRTELVQTAGVPTSPSSPRTKRNVLLGIVAGLLLGFGLAALLERLDRGVRTPEELEELFELPVLARIPRSKAFASGSIEEMLQAPEAEAFWTLRNNLRYFKVDRDIRALLIASAEPNDGKSTVARGLAGAMAAMGDDVILVEADLRKESAFRAKRVRNGLSKVLTGTPLDDALIHVPVQKESGGERRALPVLPSGPLPPNPAELLESDRMRDLLETLEKRYELVLIDTPALGSISDVLTLLPMVSEIVAVGGVGKTKRDEVREFMKQLSLRGKSPLGLIATFTQFERSRYSYYRRSQPVLRD